MSPLTFTNISYFGLRPRIISIWITESQDKHRIREHKLFAIPGQSITIAQDEAGYIENWMGIRREFRLGSEDMNLDTRPGKSFHLSLRAFSPGQIRDIKKRAKTIEGLGIFPIPIAKEAKG